jgi:hypothetical protein
MTQEPDDVLRMLDEYWPPEIPSVQLEEFVEQFSA